jgi:tetratricopeptide (TPR) repeat protein
MKLLSTTMQINSLVVGTSQRDQLIKYATNSADLAFDPSKLNTVTAQENQIVGLDVAAIDFVPANYIPASVYYSRYREQTIASIDDYKASIERLMQAITSGQDNQIRVAAEELLRVDEELRASLKVAEAPLNEMPFNRPEVQNLDFSIQDLRAQSFTLHVALATYMVQRASPEIQQETQTIVADIFKSADNFKASYETLTQSGLAIPVKFLPVILDVKTPDAIVEGDTFSLTVKISNVGQMSQQSPVTLSVSGGDKISAPANQPLPEITPNSQIEIPVNLTASEAGNEFITVEMIQDGGVIASKIVWLEIGKSKNIFSLPPTSYMLAGGLGLLCLTVLGIGGVFVYTRARKPKRAPAKPIRSPQPPKPIVSGSAEQIKKAIELAKSNREKDAFEILRGIVQAEPNNMSAWFNLGGVLASMGNYKDAERCYSRAKQLGHPRANDALNWLKQNRQ